MTMTAPCVWKGEMEDLFRLQTAISNNCTCNPENMSDVCPAHTILEDQNTLNHFEFASSQREKWFHGEFEVG